jgi:hypothetical protein
MRQKRIALLALVVAAVLPVITVSAQPAAADPTRVWCSAWRPGGELDYRACVEHTIGATAVRHFTDVFNPQSRPITTTVYLRRIVQGGYYNCTTRTITVPAGRRGSNSCNSVYQDGYAYATSGRIAGYGWVESPWVAP